MKILFSAVGNTDPITNSNDGSLMHIARVERPDKVYLYMSREMLVYEGNDQRFSRSLQLLGAHINHRFEVEKIERPELVDAHIFDTFIEDFHECLNQIYLEHPKAELCVNVSSGTPAMKSALQILSALLPYAVTPLQVSAPRIGPSKVIEDQTNYDLDLQWELNEDNGSGFRNRCKQSNVMSLRSSLQKNWIKNLVQSFDYHAALIISYEIEQYLTPTVIKLLEAARARTQLATASVQKKLSGLPYSLFPIQESDLINIVEYILNMQLALNQHRYADFVRAISPIFFELLDMNLKIHVDFDYRRYCVKVSQYKWDDKRLREVPEIRTLLTDHNDRVFGSVYADHLLQIMRHMQRLMPVGKSFPEGVLERCEDLRIVEKTVRNLAAHEIVSVTQESIEKSTSKTPKQIFRDICQLARYASPRLNQSDWLNSYDEMNRQICQLIDGID